LAKSSCSYLLIGHSVRRSNHGESDVVVEQKPYAAVRHGLPPVLCVGEGLATRQAGEHIQYTLQQLRKAIQEMTAEPVATLVVAYEPVWAIGTGEVAGRADDQEMAAALRAEIADLYDEATASATRAWIGRS